MRPATLHALLAAAAIATAASARAASVEGEVLERSRHNLTLVGGEGGAEVIRLERGGELLGVGEVSILPFDETIRWVPGPADGGVRKVRSIEVLPTVWTDPDLVVRHTALAPDDPPPADAPRPRPVDVRSRAAFARGHLRGALSAPDPGKDALARVLPKDRGEALVFYGASHQDRRPVEALRNALALGYRNARVYREGLRDWEKATRATFVAARDLRRWLEAEHTLVVDVRPPEVVAGGSLPRAWAASPSELPPAHFVGPFIPIVVVVGRDGDDPAALAAAERIRRFQPDGFKEPVYVKILEGGFPAWRAAGGKVVAAAATREAVPCLATPDAVCPDAFMPRWQQDGGERAPLLLDVRDGDEPRPPWARHLPLGRLPTELASLPRDREIWAFCRMGHTSRIAQRLLQDAGFRVRALHVPAPAWP